VAGETGGALPAGDRPRALERFVRGPRRPGAWDVWAWDASFWILEHVPEGSLVAYGQMGRPRTSSCSAAGTFASSTRSAW